MSESAVRRLQRLLRNLLLQAMGRFQEISASQRPVILLQTSGDRNESVTGTLTATSETVSGLSTLNGNVGIGGAPSATTTTKLAVTGDGTVSGNLGLGSAPSSSYRLLVTGNESVTGTLTATSETVLDCRLSMAMLELG